MTTALVAVALVPLVLFVFLFLRHPIGRELWTHRHEWGIYSAARWQEAEATARALLRSVLNEDEQRQLARQGFLTVRSATHTNRVYCIPRYRGLVHVYENGEFVESLCIGPVNPLPSGDVVLMHKLMIEGDEREYLRIANHFKARSVARRLT
ncbi:MAG: hypothetical protein HY329_07230 [Chloroflexi bacterium]|nr:hypothetical protein [Chloroflexota bacterium]